MDDLVSRQAAIDTLFELYEYQRDIDPTEAADLVRQGILLAEKRIEKLPSAQPDNQINLCDSCDYPYPNCPSKNDDVIFGNGIGNDNICACNKYKPCAQSDIVKDLVTIFQNSKDMKLISRDGDLRADRIVLGRMPFEWIPCSERLPENGTIALVCGKNGGIRVARVFIPYATGNWNGDPNTNWWTIVGTGKPFYPIAWMSLPEPYKGD